MAVTKSQAKTGIGLDLARWVEIEELLRDLTNCFEHFCQAVVAVRGRGKDMHDCSLFLAPKYSMA